MNDAYRDYESISFLRRTSQLYTLFSVVFYFMVKEKEVTEREIEKFYVFVDIYEKFKNEENVALDLSVEERNLYDLFKKYKQASSEGTRKQTNRMCII